MIRNGISGAEVARRLGVGPTTVGRWRKSAGLSGINMRNQTRLKGEALQMIHDGLSGREAARRLGVSKETIKNWRKSAGISGTDTRKLYDTEAENQVIDLLREGQSYKQIREATGVGFDAIRRIKREAEREEFL